MSRHQTGHIYEKHGAFHVRYYVEEAGERKQKSTKLYPPMTQQVRDILDGKYNTKKAPEARSRGTRDWDEIERDINK